MSNRCICLIPHFNNPAGLCRSLLSIGADNACDVLVVDDGSTELDEIALRAAFTGPGRLFVERSPQNRGIEHALNLGLQWIAQRDYSFVARLDCGDEMCPGRIGLQQQWLEQHPQVMLLGGAAECFDRTGASGVVLSPPLDHAAINYAFYRNSPFIHPAVMFRCELIEAVGPYPCDYPAAEDYAWFWRIASRFTVANLAQVLIRYELSPASISVRRRREQLRSRLRLQWEHRRCSAASLGGLIWTLGLLLAPDVLVRRLKARWQW